MLIVDRTQPTRAANPSASVAIRHPKAPPSQWRRWLPAELADFRHYRAHQNTLADVSELIACRESLRQMLATIATEENRGPRPIVDPSYELAAWNRSHGQHYRAVSDITDDHLERIATRLLAN